MKNRRIGTIEIQRSKGVEIWNIESGQFSIDQAFEGYRLNFWVQSDVNYIQQLEDTGCNPISFELPIPLRIQPSFEELWLYDYPDYRTVGMEDDDFFHNFYYYEHGSLENIQLQIQKKEEETYLIQVTGTRHDPIDRKYGDAKYTILAYLKMKTVFNGKWD